MPSVRSRVGLRATNSQTRLSLPSPQVLRAYCRTLFRRVTRLTLRPHQQLRHLGHIDGDAPRLLAREHVRRCAPTRLILAIDVSNRGPVVITDDEAGVCFVRDPRCREAAGLLSWHLTPSSWSTMRGAAETSATSRWPSAAR